MTRRPVATAGLVASLALVASTSLPREIAGAEDAVVELPAILRVPGGSFVFGATEPDLVAALELCRDEHDLAVADECDLGAFLHEGPPRRVYVRAFALDRDEVTRASYRRCVQTSTCAPPLGHDRTSEAEDLPVTGVRYADAEAYCRFVGGRLPTEEEWERAATAGDGRRFPWGSLYESRLANHGRPPARADRTDGFVGLAPVGSFPDGAGPFGHLDLAGNVWEWTSSTPRPFDVGGAELVLDHHVVRGGSYLHPAVDLRATARTFVRAGSARADLGIRCAYDAL